MMLKLWKWYQNCLAVHPVKTQIISSGFLWGVGDIVAQSITHSTAKNRPLHLHLSDADKEFRINWKRVTITSMFGFGFVGPIGHFWYEYLDRFIKLKLHMQPKSVRFVATKVATDGLIFGPLDLLVFFSYMGFSNGKSARQVQEDLKRNFIPALVLEGGAWPLMQVVNFRYVPVRYQLLYVNAFCLLDSAFLSWLEQQEDASWKQWFKSFASLNRLLSHVVRTTKTQIDSVRNMEEVVIRAADKNTKDEQIILPGFRFHPTDEELVGFYLRRKVERKPLKIELIMQVDIYKYDPWDLPITKVSTTGDKEYYFFCIRGRKYRNSVRPNRVTGSGFWKATGIDKPIYSTGETTECIGLKKSLVYYRGSAGKGTKTDWMMHEFRLPPDWKKSNQPNAKNLTQELEDWSLCRIFKRNASHKRYKPALKQTTTQQSFADGSSKSCSLESEIIDQYTSFEELALQQQKTNAAAAVHMNQKSQFYGSHDQSLLVAQSSYSSCNSNYWNPNSNDLFRDGKWDELSSVVDSASDPTILYGYYR